MLKDNKPLRIATYFDWANIASLVTFATISFLNAGLLAELICFGIITFINLIKGTLTAIGITNNDYLSNAEKRHTFLSNVLSAIVNGAIAGVFLGLALLGNNIIATIGFPLILTVTTISYWLECYFNNDSDPHGETTSHRASWIIFLACLALLGWTLTALFKPEAIPQAVGTIFSAPAWPLVTAFIGFAILIAKIIYDWKGVFPSQEVVERESLQQAIQQEFLNKRRYDDARLEAGKFYVYDYRGTPHEITNFCDDRMIKLRIDPNNWKIYYAENRFGHKSGDQYQGLVIYNFDGINPVYVDGNCYNENRQLVEKPTGEFTTYTRLFDIPTSFGVGAIMYRNPQDKHVYSVADLQWRSRYSAHELIIDDHIPQLTSSTSINSGPS